MEASPPVSAMTFEEKCRRIESIQNRISKGQAALDELVALIQETRALHDSAMQDLARAEGALKHERALAGQ